MAHHMQDMEDKLIYYKEIESGDYCCIDPRTKNYYVTVGQPDIREGRGTAVKHHPSSVCTTGISVLYLKEKCMRVKKKRNVPKIWLHNLIGKEGN